MIQKVTDEVLSVLGRYDLSVRKALEILDLCKEEVLDAGIISNKGKVDRIVKNIANMSEDNAVPTPDDVE